MLTQAILLGRLPRSGAPGGRGQRAAAASNWRWASLLSGSRGRPRAARIRSNGWLGCECPRQPCPPHRVGIISRGVRLRRGTPNPLALSPALVIPALSPAAEQALVQIQCVGGARCTHPSGEGMRDAQLDRWGRGVRSCLTV